MEESASEGGVVVRIAVARAVAARVVVKLVRSGFVGGMGRWVFGSGGGSGDFGVAVAVEVEERRAEGEKIVVIPELGRGILD